MTIRAKETVDIYANSSLTLAPLEPKHVNEIKPQAEQIDFMDRLPENWADLIHTAGDSKVITDKDGEIVSIFGILTLGDEGMTWAVHSDLFRKHARTVTRMIDDLIEKIVSEGTYSKILGFVRPHFNPGHKWMEMLKFKRNDDRHDFGEGEVIYERIM